jgi:hypothetical protein
MGYSFSMDPARWWEEHLQELTETERRANVRQEHRAHILTGACSTAVAGLLASKEAGWLVLNGSLSSSLGGLGLLCLVGAALVFMLVFWPLEGRRFREGSIEERAFLLLSDGKSWPGWLLGARSEPHQEAELSKRLAHLHKSEEVGLHERAHHHKTRELVAEFLKESLKTDLSWWLTPEGERHSVDIRYRLVFAWWASRQAARLKADLIRAGLRLVVYSVGALLLAVGLEFWGWWSLLFLVVPLWGFRAKLDF